ncbi:MAG: chromosome segregation SMC family protein [Candidatus Micrarchaeota archaeon]
MPENSNNSFFISGISFRGFKSFKSAQAKFPNGFVALAGPNGSGKSNVADAIRFCFGEMGTKAIRVKRASELINLNSSRGEVTVVIEHSSDKSKKFEIRRTISEDGKTAYTLNGKKATRTNVLEELRPYGLEVGAHNIIAQGQVQRIVEMNPKDRRAIIDQVAGIAEFDEKKKESLGELAKVEQKISDSRIVLAERASYLAELGKEKDAAIAYHEAKTSLERARATLIDSEYKKLDAQFGRILQSRSEISKEISSLQSQLDALSSQKGGLDKQRAELAQKMGGNAKKESLLEQIQSLKVEIASKQTLLDEKTARLQELEAASLELEQKKKQLSHEHSVSSAQLKQKEQYILKLKEQLEQAKKEAGIDSQQPEGPSPLEKISEQLSQVREARASTQATIAASDRSLSSYSSRQQEMAQELAKLQEQKGSSELGQFSESIDQLNKEMHALFEREKSLNKKIPEFDKSLLDAKERVAALRGSVSPASRNPAILTIKALKDAGEGGIFGTVAELISTEARFQEAAEAAAGSRLNYVITDTLETANSIIKKLKSSKSGRCSFIPLDKIIFNRHVDKVPQGSLGRMSDFIAYSPQIDNAIRYIFDDTMVVPDVSAAKKLGIGKYRMVTITGELLDRSGTITGGSHKSSLLARSSLEKAEKEVDSIKSERDSLYSGLYSVRDDMQRLRKERASLELKLRTKEAEIGSVADRNSRIERAEAEISKLSAEAAQIKSEISSSKTQVERLNGQEKALLSSLEAQKAAQAQKLMEQKEQAGQAQKNYEKALENFSSFTSEIDSNKQSLSLLQTQLDEINSQASTHAQLLSKSKAEKSSLSSAIKSHAQELGQQEAHLKEISATVEKYYNKMQKLQAELDELGKSEGQIKFQFDSQNRKLNELNIKHASASTKLADIKAEWEKHAQIPLLENAQKAELEQMVSQSESRLNELGMVNLKAPQIFEEKEQEQKQLESKIETLHSERTAVISLIDEIETKKKRLFVDTYTAVNSHFKNLFAMVFKGEGSLILDDEQNPLDSGLGMRVRAENDKRDKYLESMSGGEKTLLALMFIFSLQMRKPAPFYILDEAEAALDKQNANKMADFIRQMSKTAQFITITHHDAILSAADVVLGVAKTKDGSKIVGVRLSSGAQEPDSMPMQAPAQETTS